MSVVLAPVDFSAVTDGVVREAVRLARGMSAPLRLVHVAHPDPDFVGYDVGPQSVRDQVARTFREEHRLLQSMANALEGDGVDVEARLLQGRVVEKILEYAERAEAGWIVVGSHGHGAMYETLVGSVSKALLRKATCPVLVVTPRAARVSTEESGET